MVSARSNGTDLFCIINHMSKEKKMKFLTMLLLCLALATPAFAIQGIPVEEKAVTVYFDTDSAVLNSDSLRTLRNMVTDLTYKKEEAKAKLVILILGRTDPRGTRLHNLELGDQRAEAVRDAFVDLGIDSYQIYTASYGEEKPIALIGGDFNKENRQARVIPFEAQIVQVPLLVPADLKKNRIMLYGGLGPFLLHKHVIDPLKEIEVNQSFNPVFGLGYSRSISEKFSFGISAFTNLTFLLNVGFDF
jgi:hypothetical protein